MTPLAAAAGTTGGVWLKTKTATGGSVSPQTMVPTHHTTNLIVVPRVAAGTVAGYLVGRFVISFHGAGNVVDGELQTLASEDAIVRVLTALAANQAHGNAYRASSGLTERLKDKLNSRGSGLTVTGVTIIQLDYMQKSEVRTPRQS
jgi:hypothetical protein